MNYFKITEDIFIFFFFQAKALGRVLFEQVCKQLHLLEADYFGLEYADNHGTKVNQLDSLKDRKPKKNTDLNCHHE